MSRIRGLGTDILHVSRIEKIFKRGPEPFSISKHVTKLAERVLNPHKELPVFQDYRNQNTDSGFRECVRLFATSWASKEAVYKCLDPAEQRKFSMAHWYKQNDQHGRPFIIGPQYSKIHPMDKFLLSVSHDADLVTATVIRSEDGDPISGLSEAGIRQTTP
ncbi:unnamed protein product [Kuraishia capsulata CBS 1993]|uniref:4'-phosphopantetheinyl transferase domain-containing protein n=1 Tax=Kuraishia capsulata CBS 1993 TaxID=1382522 RepID=W6MNR4_9ASCO|nr:uncharacterized protein KUCA_T00003898001 [Kuraishia capsulata CBS 1993]CDK27918.1 unnamed protein product [Kuraishia capsulata CBS 1993]